MSSNKERFYVSIFSSLRGLSFKSNTFEIIYYHKLDFGQLRNTQTHMTYVNIYAMSI